MNGSDRDKLEADIKVLRERGYTYKQIAEKFNVSSEDTVRMFSKKDDVSKLMIFPFLVKGFTKGGY